MDRRCDATVIGQPNVQRREEGFLESQWASLGAQTVKSSAVREAQVQSLGQEDPLEECMATHSSILAWRIPRTEEPGGLESTRSQRVRHN